MADTLLIAITWRSLRDQIIMGAPRLLGGSGLVGIILHDGLFSVIMSLLLSSSVTLRHHLFHVSRRHPLILSGFLIALSYSILLVVNIGLLIVIENPGVSHVLYS